MATIVLFHSVLGLRRIERSAVARLEVRGHIASAPDLFGGRTAATPHEGFAIMDEIGWDLICSRARLALDRVPPGAVLAGFSMGAGVISTLWPERPGAGAVLLLHGLADVPQGVNPQLPVQVHLADPDPFVPPPQLTVWKQNAADAGLSAQVHLYPNAGHFFTDEGLDDFDARASELTWSRVIGVLDMLGSSNQSQPATT
jgi:dienelactone hydrolase